MQKSRDKRRVQRFWETTTIWNRLEPDGHLQHQTPAVGKTNYAYVKVHNRGTQSASFAAVHAYHSHPAAGLVWPETGSRCRPLRCRFPEAFPRAEKFSLAPSSGVQIIGITIAC